MFKTIERKTINNDTFIIDAYNGVPVRKIRDFCEIDPTYDRLTDINPIQIGHEVTLDCFMPEFLIHSVYIVHFVHKGKGYYIDDTGKYEIGTNQMFIIKPQNICKYYADKNDPWEYSWIRFDGQLAKIFDSLSPVQPVSFTLFEKIKEFTQNDTMAAKFHIVAILFEIISSITNRKQSPVDYVFIVKRLIENNYMHDISVKNIAQRLFVSRQYISKLFTEKEGITIQEYIIKVRLETAINFMREGFNISECADSVGYSDMYTFSRIFKKKYGIAPSQYIKNITLKRKPKKQKPKKR